VISRIPNPTLRVRTSLKNIAVDFAEKYCTSLKNIAFEHRSKILQLTVFLHLKWDSNLGGTHKKCLVSERFHRNTQIIGSVRQILAGEKHPLS